MGNSFTAFSPFILGCLFMKIVNEPTKNRKFLRHVRFLILEFKPCPCFLTEVILEQLRLRLDEFELTSSPVRPISGVGPSSIFFNGINNRFFARISPSIGGGSPALKKSERYSIQKVTGDGLPVPCSDELWMAVKDELCGNSAERHQYEEALIAITVEESLKHYCQRIGRSDFLEGESELLVLSKLCSQPITVYIPEHEHGGKGYGFIPIAEYWAEFCKGSRKGNPRKVVRLLYSGKNHYDLTCLIRVT